MAGQKKYSDTFTIKFNTDIPRHQMAVEALNTLGRKKADFISRLFEAAARHPELLEEVGIVIENGSLLRSLPNMDNKKQFVLGRSEQNMGIEGENLSHNDMSPVAVEMQQEISSRSGVLRTEEDRKRTDGAHEAAGAPKAEIVQDVPSDPNLDGLRANMGKMSEKVPDAEEEKSEDLDMDEDIPEEMRASLLANLQYFDGMGDDDDDYDDE